MKFSINKISLWLSNQTRRDINFVPNKINIITGESNTGKSAILSIIDYCFFASKHNISHSIINENALWYSINFKINGKKYTLAREAPIGSRIGKKYYFSAAGNIPSQTPIANNSEAAIKKTIETEFNINKDTKINFGSHSIQAGSKVSLRYFFMFNTLSEDTITDSSVFFDKQNENRYRDALPRVFDLAVGIDTVENSVLKEHLEGLNYQVRRLEKKLEITDEKTSNFEEELGFIIKTFKEYGLIKEDEKITNPIKIIQDVINDAHQATLINTPHAYKKNSNKIREIKKKLSLLREFELEYKEYKKDLKNVEDSLKPINFLQQNFPEVLKNSFYGDIIEQLSIEFSEIKKTTKNKTPLNSNLNIEINKLQANLEKLLKQDKDLAQEIKLFQNNGERLIFIGETKAKLSLYATKGTTKKDSLIKELEKLNNEISEITVSDIEENKQLFFSNLHIKISEYMKTVGNALVNYEHYHPYFRYKDKTLHFKHPHENFVDNTGSSSNHMFLHLFLFLGLHEIIQNRNISYIAPLLIIDQFSRPYWNTKSNQLNNNSDQNKINAALRLLNSYMQNIHDQDKEFQMIIFEHIPKEMWKEYDHIHLVEEFIDGNALIHSSNDDMDSNQ